MGFNGVRKHQKTEDPRFLYWCDVKGLVVWGEAANATPGNRHIFVGGAEYEGQPIMITEFGGIAYQKGEQEGWGYSGAENDNDYLERLQAVIRPLYGSPIVRGFCYTQLTDVEQEINGLLTYDRQPKVPLEQIRRIVLNQG